MRTINDWLNEYGESHKNETNKLIHWICVPAIFFSILGMLYAVKLPFHMGDYQLNVGLIISVTVLLYYFSLSASLSVGMFLYLLVCMLLANLIESSRIMPLWLFSIIIFGFIWINFEPFVFILHLNKEFLAGKNVLLILSIANIIEMGTGINGQIIGTSTLWKFEFYTNLILGIIITTCSYFFTKYFFGINGPAVALLLGIIVYNFIRIYFLYRKFNFFPFNSRTVLAITLLPTIIVIAKLSLLYLPFYLGILLANAFMAFLFAVSIYRFNLSPDIKPIMNHFLKKINQTK